MEQLNFFDLKSIGSFAGASLAVLIVGNTIRMLFKWDSPWPAFLASVLLAILVASQLNKLATPVDWLVIFLNSCLLFCNASGVQEIGRFVTTPTPVGGAKKQSGKINFFSSWFQK